MFSCWQLYVDSAHPPLLVTFFAESSSGPLSDDDLMQIFQPLLLFNCCLTCSPPKPRSLDFAFFYSFFFIIIFHYSIRAIPTSTLILTVQVLLLFFKNYFHLLQHSKYGKFAHVVLYRIQYIYSIQYNISDLWQILWRGWPFHPFHPFHLFHPFHPFHPLPQNSRRFRVRPSWPTQRALAFFFAYWTNRL